MDPYVQAALIAGGAGVIVFVILRFIVPLLPGDGREQERLAAMRKTRAEREAAAKLAE